MRSCSICKQNKLKSEYFYRDKKLNKLHTQCKTCYSIRRKSTWQDYYYKKGSLYRQNAINRNKRIKSELQKNILNLLRDKKCVICGINDVRVLDFDHINPSTKSFSIARAINNGVRWEKILIEIKKCQILCANCHKIKTANEQGWYRNYDKRHTSD